MILVAAASTLVGEKMKTPHVKQQSMVRDALYHYRFQLADDEDVSKYTSPVVDGDSVYGWLDRGFNDWSLMLCRLAYIDAPERGMDGYSESTNALRDTIQQCESVILNSEKLGKYGRPVGTLWGKEEPDSDTWFNINEWMIDNGYAEWYDD